MTAAQDESKKFAVPADRRKSRASQLRAENGAGQVTDAYGAAGRNDSGRGDGLVDDAAVEAF